MKPFYTNNFADVKALEGLYVMELTPPGVVLGTNLNTVGIVGGTIKGPVNKGVAIASAQRMADVFGLRDLGSGGLILNDVWKAMLNKKLGTPVVFRVANSADTAATATTSDGYLQLDASSVGAHGNLTTFQVQNATDGNTDHFNLVIVDYAGKHTVYNNLDISGSTDNTLAVVGDDEANPIVLTKLGSGRPVNQGPTALAGGTTNALADADFTAAGGPLETADNDPDVNVVLTTTMSDNIKAKLMTLAGANGNKIYLMGPNSLTTSFSSAQTDVATYRSANQNVVYCFNTPYTLDPQVGVQIQVAPQDWMACILSQTFVDINPGSESDTNALLQGITKLSTPMFRGDYISARVAGIAALEKGDSGFSFHSGVNTFLPDGTGREQIDSKRERIFLNTSIGNALTPFVKKKDTLARRAAMVAEIDNFLGGLKKAESIVADYSIDNVSLNTPELRAQGIEQILIKVRLINDILELVIQAEVGTDVTISSNA